MNKPQLIKTTPEGGTIHSYQLTGGLHTYERYLACNIGVCEFHNTLNMAETYLEKMT